MGGGAYGLSFARGRPTTYGPTVGVQQAGRLFVKMRSYTSYALTGASGAFSTAKAIKLNSVFDPFGTTSSIKAVGYPQYATLYQSYQVHACRVKLTICNNNASVPVTIVFGPAPNLTAAPTTISDACGQRFARHVAVAGTNGGPAVVTLASFNRMNQLAGDVPNSLTIDDTYSALTGTDPATLIIGNISGQSLDGSSSWGVLIGVEVIQYCCWFGPNALTYT